MEERLGIPKDCISNSAIMQLTHNIHHMNPCQQFVICMVILLNNLGIKLNNAEFICAYTTYLGDT